MSPILAKPLRLLVLWPLCWGIPWGLLIAFLDSGLHWPMWAVVLAALVAAPVFIFLGSIVADLLTEFLVWIYRLFNRDSI